MVQSAIYVGISAQLALLRRLDTIANNVANQGTAGFRSEHVTFESIVSDAEGGAVEYVSRGAVGLSRNPGELVQTGNPLDIAIDGASWLSVETPSGRAYTRDGRLTITQTGELHTLTGFPVLDAGGSVLKIDAQKGPPEFSRDGAINQSGRKVGMIGLFQIDADAKLERIAGGAVVSDRPAEPQLDGRSGGIVQGFVERSNANPIEEMTKLITVQRAFDSVSSTISMIEAGQADAIRALGGG